MRICVSGTQNIGKTTFIEDFLNEFPMYKKPEKSYRDVLKEKNLKVNREGSKDSQEVIMNFICDQAMNYTSNSNVIYDRGILDNVIHTLYLNDKDPSLVPDGFVQKSLQICRETCKFYDIIFLLPDIKFNNIIIEERENRDTDPNYRSEIDLLFKDAYKTYLDNRTLFFDKNDKPCIIEIFGSREERIAMVKMYLDNKTGKLLPPNKIYWQKILIIVRSYYEI